MLDLSSNNGNVDFDRVYAHAKPTQRRVYVKRSGDETSDHQYLNPTWAGYRRDALKAGFLVGGYHYATTRVTPSESVSFFLSNLGRLDLARSLRPAVDFEDGTPSPDKGRWILEWQRLFANRLGYPAVFYSYPAYIQGLALPGKAGRWPLWLASYGRNDGREYPYQIPAPWKTVAAHQYSSQARVAGIDGLVDISHVFNGRPLSIPRSL